MEAKSPASEHGQAFPTTQWTVVIDAVSTNPERAREALEKLCGDYRQPIVNWFKRNDFYQNPEDLTHDFVAYLIKKSLLSKVAARTGKFRCFLATAMQKFLWDSWDRNGAKKRGGGVEKVSLADNDVDIGAETDPDSQLDADFAFVIHQKVMEQLAPQADLKPYIFKRIPAKAGMKSRPASIRPPPPSAKK
jgi:hypothetical protein